MSDAFEWDVVEYDPQITRDGALHALRVPGGSDSTGTPAGHDGRFAGRAEAEEFLGENWRTLAASGIRSVRLLHAGEPVETVVLAAAE